MTTTPVDQQLPSSLNDQFINYSVNSETQNMDKNETVNMDNNNQNTDLTSRAKNEEENLINFDASEEMKKSIEMIRSELTDSTSYTFLTKSVASINLADIENDVVNKPAFQLLTSQQSPFNSKSTCTDNIAEMHSSTLPTTDDDVADLSKPQHVVVQNTLDNVSSTSNNFSALFDPLSISNDPVDSKASSVDKQLLSTVEVSSSSVMKTETILDKSPELLGEISATSEVGNSEPSESIGIADNDSTPDSTVQLNAPHTEIVELPPVDHHLVKHFQNVEAEKVDQILSKSDSAEIFFTPSTIITEPLKITDNTTTEQQQPVEIKSTLAAKKSPDANGNKKKASAGIKPRSESATATTPKVSSNHQNLKQTPSTTTTTTTTTTGKLTSSSRPVSSKLSGRKTTTTSPLVSSTGTARTAPRAAASVSSKTPPSKNLSKSTATTSTTFKSSSITAKSSATKSSSTAHKTDSKYMTNGALKSNSIEKKPIAKRDSTTTTTRKTVAPTSTTTTTTTTTAGVKRIEARKLEWNVKAKVGSLENAQHKPTTTGRVQIYNRKLNFKNAKSKIGSMDNIKHKPAGGNVKIFEQKVDFKSKASPKYDIGITKKKEITVEASADQATAATASAAAAQPMQQQN
ncbi:Microtubule-associated protein 4 [Trichinella pseudospiralis]|uniref:Microtubule-associated protein n=1 Tax=Trichinella pseudospiralis TaxID=6337 RepID=A0A0V1F159_TRIPS|nr:Microtubule-associated protein 4 [Trichinella pseudospiralis]